MHEYYCLNLDYIRNSVERPVAKAGRAIQLS